jgi:bacillithiol biosynthesis cysteine-adding enzyme BshC
MGTFQKRTIPYSQTSLLSKLISDYINQLPHLTDFYNRSDTIESYRLQIEEKAANYPLKHRFVLSESLQKQYGDLKITSIVRDNIAALKDEKTFTITTGHQLSLFTGPLYFIYKIVSAIKTATLLKNKYPEYQFVPVYWMATEDHDFQEIASFATLSGKLTWKKNVSGAVGRLDTTGLQQLFSELKLEFPEGKNAKKLLDLFEKTYLKHNSLTEATRFLVNELFGEKGLVIVDGDDKELKQLFTPYLEMELQHSFSYEAVCQTNEQLSGYNIQVNPREINLFYMKDSIRSRIVREERNYNVLDTEITFSEEQLAAELHKYPERFSPNVILRPLYQEVILPNLSYIGGAGELAYWLQLKAVFQKSDIVFPILKLRNSVIVLSEKEIRKIEKLRLDISDLLKNGTDLSTFIAVRSADFSVNLTHEKAIIQELFSGLEALVQKTDASFAGAVSAQKQKQLNGLLKLEKRLLNAQKRKNADEIARALELRKLIFPLQTFQERILNFSVFYKDLGDTFTESLIDELDPFDISLTILIFKN